MTFWRIFIIGQVFGGMNQVYPAVAHGRQICLERIEKEEEKIKLAGHLMSRVTMRNCRKQRGTHLCLQREQGTSLAYRDK